MKKTYDYHKPSEAGLQTIAQLRKAFSDLHDKVEQLAPNTRERSVALTNLEQAAMWAIKAVVCNDPEFEITLFKDTEGPGDPAVPMPFGTHENREESGQR